MRVLLRVCASLNMLLAAFCLLAMAGSVKAQTAETASKTGPEASTIDLPASEIAAQANRFGQEDDITVITLDWRAPATA